jgi:hypothetical protein
VSNIDSTVGAGSTTGFFFAAFNCFAENGTWSNVSDGSYTKVALPGSFNARTAAMEPSAGSEAENRAYSTGPIPVRVTTSTRSMLPVTYNRAKR